MKLIKIKRRIVRLDRTSLNHITWYWCKDAALRWSVLWWLFFLGGCATTDPFAKLEEWREIQSKNFIVYTNAPKSVAFDVIKEFEVFRVAALKITTIPPFEETNPIRIYLFKDRNSFAPFKPTENTGGYFIPEINYIALYATPFEENHQHSTVYHEYTHYLISKHPAIIPKWFNEGLATMFETFELNRGVVKFGIPQYHRWMFLRDRASWIPMKEFLSDQTNYLHEEDKKSAQAYSQAWALTHYFILGKKENLAKFEQYLYLVNNGFNSNEALLSSFGMTPEKLLQEVKGYVEKDTLPYSTMKIEDMALDHHYHIRSLKEGEARQVIQDLKGIADDFRNTISSPVTQTPQPRRACLTGFYDDCI